MIYWNSKNSENVGYAGEESVVWELAVDFLSLQQQVTKDTQVLREVRAKI
jgi:hypothetical protein